MTRFLSRPIAVLSAAGVSLTLASTGAVSSSSSQAPAAAQRPASVDTAAADAQRAEFLNMFGRGYFPGRTGQIMVVPREGDIITRDDPGVVYMHGSPWPYDTDIPLFFAGPRVVRGNHATPVVQQDVAVTMASALGTAMPKTATGRVLPIIRQDLAPSRAVLLIVLDGMRRDYLERHAKQMPTLAARRAASAWFTTARVNYLPSNTAAGHSTIATGAEPRVHGVTGNNMYDRIARKRHDVLEGWEPRDLAAVTIADVWQLQTAGRGIVISQGSSVPSATALGGHGACQLNGTPTIFAGYEELAGRWNTNPACFTLPPAVRDFDARTLWPADGMWMGHKIDTPSGVRRSGLFPRFEADAFVRMIETQPIGADAVPDLLLLNFKGADFVGHKHGPDSPELAATLAEMDRQLARILAALEAKVGNDYLLVVTADHGMPAEPADKTRRHYAATIVDQLHARFDPSARALVTYYEPENSQIFIDLDRLAALKLTLKDLTAFLESQPFIYAAFTEDEVRRAAR